jgi:hypothetical protein
VRQPGGRGCGRWRGRVDSLVWSLRSHHTSIVGTERVLNQKGGAPRTPTCNLPAVGLAFHRRNWPYALHVATVNLGGWGSSARGSCSLQKPLSSLESSRSQGLLVEKQSICSYFSCWKTPRREIDNTAALSHHHPKPLTPLESGCGGMVLVSGVWCLVSPGVPCSRIAVTLDHDIVCSSGLPDITWLQALLCLYTRSSRSPVVSRRVDDENATSEDDDDDRRA